MDADNLYGRFDRFLKSLELTRRNFEELASKGHLPRRDVERAYEGLFLNAFTNFEVFVEDLFFGLLAGRITGGSCGAQARVQVNSDRIAREIVLRERKYIDWLPYKRTEELASAFFRGGRPFTLVTDGDKGNLTIHLAVRHAIAHKSDHAQGAFRTKVIGATPLPPRERTPAGFLRSQYRIAPSQTRFELYVSELRAIAHRISH